MTSEVYNHIPLSDAPTSVNNALNEISDNLQRQEISPAFPTYNTEPERVYDGLTLYADGTNWNPGDGAGLYIYHSGEWIFLSASPEITIIGAEATDDAGDGTVAGDVNATDFTSQVGTTFLPVAVSDYLLVEHKNVAYIYIGPRPVNLGVGGDYVSVADDYVPTGTNDHALLVNRNAADAHPMSAITGLLADQTRQDDALVAHEAAANPHPTYRDHSLQTNRNIADQHPMSAITGLDADQVRQDDNLQAHLDDPGDPHPQYRQKQAFAAFWGAPGNMTIGTGAATVANWPNAAAGNAIWDLNPVAGTMVIPEDGLYELTAWVIGNQGNDTKEESLRLLLDVDGTNDFIDVFDIATDKTSDRSLSASFVRRYTAGQTVSLLMNATTGLGTFAFRNGTFELEKIGD